MEQLNIHVDRQQFIRWTQGFFINVNTKKGERTIVDELQCEKAMSALEGGSAIGLTVEGELTSIMQSVGGEYIERLPPVKEGSNV